MKSTFGNNLIVSLFGESHGKVIGATVSGVPAGILINDELIKSLLSRRRPNNPNETKRIEKDDYEIVSGAYNGYTTGAPFTILIKNEDIDSSKYLDGVIRPGTSDYPSYVRSDGFADLRGAGHFSGRLTAPLVAIYGILKPLLDKKNIVISTKVDEKEYDDNDTHGFTSKIVVKGMPIGVGEPFFDSVESVLSHLLFSIPSVKGVSFGDSDISNISGSEAKDELIYKDGKVVIMNNHNGGINGGLTNGNDIVINVSFKPIPSIASTQNTINIKTKENITLNIEGRHDKSIKNRVSVILESMVAIGLIDLLISFYGSNELK